MQVKVLPPAPTFGEAGFSEQKDRGQGSTDISAPRLIETYKKKLAQRIINGDINLADELAKLAVYQERARRKKASPTPLKPKRRYTFSVEAHEARIKNAQKSTGPNSAGTRSPARRTLSGPTAISPHFS